MCSNCLYRSGAINREWSTIWRARSCRSATIRSIIDGTARGSTIDGYIRGGIIESDDWRCTRCRSNSFFCHFSKHHAIANHNSLNRKAFCYGNRTTVSRCGGTSNSRFAAINSIENGKTSRYLVITDAECVYVRIKVDGWSVKYDSLYFPIRGITFVFP